MSTGSNAEHIDRADAAEQEFVDGELMDSADSSDEAEVRMALAGLTDPAFATVLRSAIGSRPGFAAVAGQINALIDQAVGTVGDSPVGGDQVADIPVPPPTSDIPVPPPAADFPNADIPAASPPAAPPLVSPQLTTPNLTPPAPSPINSPGGIAPGGMSIGDQSGLTGSAVTGIPTLDEVQDRIERRYGRALGSAELAGETKSVQDYEKKKAADVKAAQDALDAIRRSLHPEK